MTRDELIAHIEAGETGPEINKQVHILRGLCIHPMEAWKDSGYQDDTGFTCLSCGADSWGNEGRNGERFHGGTPDYTTSLDAAVVLIGDVYWFVDSFGKASVWGECVKRGESRINGNPAAALVAAWLKATA